MCLPVLCWLAKRRRQVLSTAWLTATNLLSSPRWLTGLERLDCKWEEGVLAPSQRV